MKVGDRLRKNLEFWHWYPRLLCQGLTDAQLHWQPPGNSNHIVFALWHAYRAEDHILHRLLIGGPPVFEREGWARRLPVPQPGNPPIGTGLGRDQIAAIRLRLDDVLEYAEAVGRAVQAYVDGLTDEQAAEVVPLPFFQSIYPMLDAASREEIIAFFSIGHTAEHLGEVQYIKGLLGMRGAPL